MKKTTLAGYIIGAILLMGLGFIGGYFMGIFNSLKEAREWSERQRAFQVRTEAYEPSCDELRKIGRPSVVKRGHDRFVVHVSEDSFVVFGFNAEPGKAPVTAWWGAGRKEALNQACGKKRR